MQLPASTCIYTLLLPEYTPQHTPAKTWRLDETDHIGPSVALGLHPVRSDHLVPSTRKVQFASCMSRTRSRLHVPTCPYVYEVRHPPPCSLRRVSGTGTWITLTFLFHRLDSQSDTSASHPPHPLPRFRVLHVIVTPIELPPRSPSLGHDAVCS